MHRGILSAFIVLLVGINSSSIHAQYGYFYSGKDYGSEAIFNPLTQIMSGGFDMVHVYRVNSKMSTLRIPTGFRIVLNSVSNPRKAIGDWDTFVDNEIFPRSLNSLIDKNAGWVPNYTLHLIGGGMEYARLVDYYSYYGIKNPKTWALLTSTIEQVLNESIESAYKEEFNPDALADLLIFNPLGYVLFNMETVQKFFSETIELRSWFSQTSYSIRNNSIQNIGQFWAIKIQPEFAGNFSFFHHFGAGYLIGAGYTKGPNTLSIGAGFRTFNVFLDEANNRYAINIIPSYGFFLDKNNSLLASFVYAHGSNYHENFKVEIFPGLIKTPFQNLKMGFWINASYDFPSYVGITIGNFPSIAF